MVTAVASVVAAVVDPELRVVTIDELGILRDVDDDGDGRVTVTITPTYTGCPAMDVDPRRHPRRAGRRPATRRSRCAPSCARLDHRLDHRGRAGAKLAAAGIAPPGHGRPAPVRAAR